jgi:hypothetical protein
MKKVSMSALSHAEWNGNDDHDFCACRTDIHLRRQAGFCPAEGEEGISQMCNRSPQNYISPQDVTTYCSGVTAVNKRREGIVTTSAVAPEVDRAIGYSDNPSMIAEVFCGYICREEAERR